MLAMNNSAVVGECDENILSDSDEDCWRLASEVLKNLDKLHCFMLDNDT